MATIEELEKRIKKLEEEKADKPGCIVGNAPSWGTGIWIGIFLCWLAVSDWGWSREGRCGMIPVTYETLEKAGIIEFKSGLQIKHKSEMKK